MHANCPKCDEYEYWVEDEILTITHPLGIDVWRCNHCSTCFVVKDIKIDYEIVE